MRLDIKRSAVCNTVANDLAMRRCDYNDCNTICWLWSSMASCEGYLHWNVFIGKQRSHRYVCVTIGRGRKATYKVVAFKVTQSLRASKHQEPFLLSVEEILDPTMQRESRKLISSLLICISVTFYATQVWENMPTLVHLNLPFWSSGSLQLWSLRWAKRASSRSTRTCHIPWSLRF